MSESSAAAARVNIHHNNILRNIFLLELLFLLLQLLFSAVYASHSSPFADCTLRAIPGSMWRWCRPCLRAQNPTKQCRNSIPQWPGVGDGYADGDIADNCNINCACNLQTLCVPCISAVAGVCCPPVLRLPAIQLLPPRLPKLSANTECLTPRGAV